MYVLKEVDLNKRTHSKILRQRTSEESMLIIPFYSALFYLTKQVGLDEDVSKEVLESGIYAQWDTLRSAQVKEIFDVAPKGFLIEDLLHFYLEEYIDINNTLNNRKPILINVEDLVSEVYGVLPPVAAYHPIILDVNIDSCSIRWRNDDAWIYYYDRPNVLDK